VIAVDGAPKRRIDDGHGVNQTTVRWARLISYPRLSAARCFTLARPLWLNRGVLRRSSGTMHAGARGSAAAEYAGHQAGGGHSPRFSPRWEPSLMRLTLTQALSRIELGAQALIQVLLP